MNGVPSSSSSAGAERMVAAALDHFAGLLGYAVIPEGRPAAGGFRRLYVKDVGDAEDAAEGILAAVAGEGGGFVSLGIEIVVPRGRLTARSADLLAALAPYEVALDPDAGADPHAPEAVVRVALRLFTEGMTAGTVRDAVQNLTEAAAETRRTLGV